MEPQNQNSNLLEELEKVILAGDEAAATAFIKQYFNEFPEEMKQELAAQAVLDAGARDIADTENKRRSLVEILNALKETLGGKG